MKILILASGKGSNARAILNNIKEGNIPETEVYGIFSDFPDAPALDIAKEFGIVSRFVDPMKKCARFSPEGTQNYLDAFDEVLPDLIVLAGFMRILPPEIVEKWQGKIINLHPSLLPAYKGIRAIERTFEAGEKFGGCSVHYVSNELDGGEIIAQSKIEILPNDTLESYETRLHAEEHKLLPAVIAKFAKGEIA